MRRRRAGIDTAVHVHSEAILQRLIEIGADDGQRDHLGMPRPLAEGGVARRG